MQHSSFAWDALPLVAAPSQPALPTALLLPSVVPIDEKRAIIFGGAECHGAPKGSSIPAQMMTATKVSSAVWCMTLHQEEAVNNGDDPEEEEGMSSHSSFSLKMDQWTTDDSELPTKVDLSRFGHSACVWNQENGVQEMAVFGGSSEGLVRVSSEVLLLDTSSLKWRRMDTTGLAALNGARVGHSAAIDESRGLMYVYGGMRSSRRLLKDMLVLNLRTGVWTTIAPETVNGCPPPSKFGSTMAFHNQDDSTNTTIIIAGGVSSTVAEPQQSKSSTNNAHSMTIHTLDLTTRSCKSLRLNRVNPLSSLHSCLCRHNPSFPAGTDDLDAFCSSEGESHCVTKLSWVMFPFTFTLGIESGRMVVIGPEDAESPHGLHGCTERAGGVEAMRSASGGSLTSVFESSPGKKPTMAPNATQTTSRRPSSPTTLKKRPPNTASTSSASPPKGKGLAKSSSVTPGRAALTSINLVLNGMPIHIRLATSKSPSPMLLEAFILQKGSGLLPDQGNPVFGMDTKTLSDVMEDFTGQPLPSLTPEDPLEDLATAPSHCLVEDFHHMSAAEWRQGCGFIDDVWGVIMSFLDLRHILTLGTTCSTVYRIANAPEMWDALLEQHYQRRGVADRCYTKRLVSPGVGPKGLMIAEAVAERTILENKAVNQWSVDLNVNKIENWAEGSGRIAFFGEVVDAEALLVNTSNFLNSKGMSPAPPRSIPLLAFEPIQKVKPTCVAMDRSGRNLLAVGCVKSSAVAVFNSISGELVALLKGHTRTVSDLEWFTADNDDVRLVSTSLDGTVIVWDPLNPDAVLTTPDAAAGEEEEGIQSDGEEVTVCARRIPAGHLKLTGHIGGVKTILGVDCGPTSAFNSNQIVTWALGSVNEVVVHDLSGSRPNHTLTGLPSHTTPSEVFFTSPTMLLLKCHDKLVEYDLSDGGAAPAVVPPPIASATFSSCERLSASTFLFCGDASTARTLSASCKGFIAYYDASSSAHYEFSQTFPDKFIKSIKHVAGNIFAVGYNERVGTVIIDPRSTGEKISQSIAHLMNLTRSHVCRSLKVSVEDSSSDATVVDPRHGGGGGVVRVGAFDGTSYHFTRLVFAATPHLTTRRSSSFVASASEKRSIKVFKAQRKR